MDDPQISPPSAEPDDARGALLRQADDLIATDRPAEAIPLLTRLVEQEPADSTPLQRRAWAYFHAGNADAARADAQRFLLLFPDNAQGAAGMGELYTEMAAPEEAQAALAQAAAGAGDDADLLDRIAAAYEEIAAYDSALALYERLVPLRPRDALQSSAQVRRAQGDTEGALHDLDRALAAPSEGSDPTWEVNERALIWRDRAEIYLERHELEAAEAAARTALDLLGDSPLAAAPATLLAQVALERQDLPAAREAGEDAVRLDPRYLPGWLILIASYPADSTGATQLAVIHRAQEYHPTDQNLVLTASLVYGKLGDSNGMLAEWSRLVAADPDNASARTIRGGILLRLGRPDEARPDIDRALELDPEGRLAWEFRAQLLLDAGNARGALTAINRALSLAPDRVEALLLRAAIQLRLGNLVAVAADYARVIDLAPDNADARSGLGNIQMGLGQPERALENYQAALRAQPNVPLLQYNVATAQAQLGRCALAVDLLGRAIAADPELATDAQEDPFFDDCRQYPGFAAALRGKGGGRPAPRPKARKRR